MFSWFTRRRRPADPSPAGARRLFIPEALYRKMLLHCQEERPLEACGLLAGIGGHVVEAFAADNEHRSPVVYKVDDRQLLEAFQTVQRRKQEIIAIYHSHVKTAPVPSRTDIEQATWPEAFYVIVSLAGRRPLVRAWRIVDRHVTEHQVIIQKDATGVWHDLRRAVRRPADQGKPPDIP